jgi:hypothetical protein
MCLFSGAGSDNDTQLSDPALFPDALHTCRFSPMFDRICTTSIGVPAGMV